jgi:hypothetical protein
MQGICKNVQRTDILFSEEMLMFLRQQTVQIQKKSANQQYGI